MPFDQQYLFNLSHHPAPRPRETAPSAFGPVTTALPVFHINRIGASKCRPEESLGKRSETAERTEQVASPGRGKHSLPMNLYRPKGGICLAEWTLEMPGEETGKGHGIDLKG